MSSIRRPNTKAAALYVALLPALTGCSEAPQYVLGVRISMKEHATSEQRAIDDMKRMQNVTVRSGNFNMDDVLDTQNSTSSNKQQVENDTGSETNLLHRLGAHTGSHQIMKAQASAQASRALGAALRNQLAALRTRFSSGTQSPSSGNHSAPAVVGQDTPWDRLIAKNEHLTEELVGSAAALGVIVYNRKKLKRWIKWLVGPNWNITYRSNRAEIGSFDEDGGLDGAHRNLSECDIGSNQQSSMIIKQELLGEDGPEKNQMPTIFLSMDQMDQGFTNGGHRDQGFANLLKGYNASHSTGSSTLTTSDRPTEEDWEFRNELRNLNQKMQNLMVRPWPERRADGKSDPLVRVDWKMQKDHINSIKFPTSAASGSKKHDTVTRENTTLITPNQQDSFDRSGEGQLGSHPGNNYTVPRFVWNTSGYNPFNVYVSHDPEANLHQVSEKLDVVEKPDDVEEVKPQYTIWGQLQDDDYQKAAEKRKNAKAERKDDKYQICS